MPSPLILTGLPEPVALAALGELGATTREARKLWAAAVQRGLDVEGLTQVPQVRRPVLDAVAAAVVTPRLTLLEARTDPSDGFTKYLFELADGARIETVRIPIFDTHYVVCISSQVGCAVGCTFCATGRMGFGRDLLPWEMVEQVLAVRRESDRPVRGVVFMGMGEPLLNLDHGLAAASILSAPSGGAIAAANITFSTSGIVPAMRAFTEGGHKYRLVVSLTSALSEKRGQVIPIEKKWPVEAVWAAAREHAEARGKRVTLAYVLIRGFNTGVEDAEALARLIGDTPVILDLIDVNDATGQYLPPTPAELEGFRDALQRLGQPVVRRYSGGKSIEAACGMLATN